MSAVRPLPARPKTNLRNVPKQIRDQMGVPKGPDGKALKPTPKPPTKKVTVHPSGKATVKVSNQAIWVPSERGRRRFVEDAAEILSFPKRQVMKPVDLVRDVYQSARNPDRASARYIKSLHPASNERLLMEAADMAAPRGSLFGGRASQELATGPLSEGRRAAREAIGTHRAIAKAVRRRRALAMLGLFGLGGAAAKAVVGD